MAAQKTIFQQLGDLFGPEISKRENKSRYSLNDKELLKTKYYLMPNNQLYSPSSLLVLPGC